MDGFGSLLLYLPIASFALAIGALVAKFTEKSVGARSQLITAILVFLILASGATGFLVWDEGARTRALANEIVDVIANQQRTYDEILAEIKNPDRASIASAMELLDAQQRVGSRTTAIVSKSDNRIFRVRTYYVRTFNN